MITRSGRRLIGALLTAAVLSVLALAAPAAAANSVESVTAHIMWLRCQDESEPASDEPSLRVNGWPIGSWTNVDSGDVLTPHTQQIQFSGTLTVELWESDGTWGFDHLGNFYIYEFQAGMGEQETYVFGNGEYILRFWVG